MKKKKSEFSYLKSLLGAEHCPCAGNTLLPMATREEWHLQAGRACDAEVHLQHLQACDQRLVEDGT